MSEKLVFGANLFDKYIIEEKDEIIVRNISDNFERKYKFIWYKSTCKNIITKNEVDILA